MGFAELHGPSPALVSELCLILAIRMNALRVVIALGVLAWAGMPAPSNAVATAAPVQVVIGFVGDSITFDVPPGGHLAPPDLTVQAISTQGRVVRAINEGHQGASTADWLPDARIGYLGKALAAFQQGGVSIVHIMLGTNDAKPTGANISPAQYRANLAIICRVLNGAGFVVVLSYPPYAALPKLSAAGRTTMERTLVAYETVINRLANGVTVRLGDTHAYTYFQAHPWLLADGVHPNAGGAAALAQLWATALRPAIVGDHSEESMAPARCALAMEWRASVTQGTSATQGLPRALPVASGSM